ncbi:MAG: tyrosine transporter [Parachlamydiaceae bacterium]|nr:tyrosine transporter [Parachlamydiaceae bacterium]
MNIKGNLLGGALLVAGTTIGGGMLALPVLTSLAGFFPSLLIYLLCWLFMASTGLLFLEVAQWMKSESNILSMADFTLGKPGRYFAWALYLFLFYCLTIAYIVGCGNIVSELSGFVIPDWLGPLLFVIVFAPLILIQTSLAGKLNIYLVAGLAISYLAFVILGFRYVNPELLMRADWSSSLMVLPIAFTSFAYQGIIPTLVTYMHGDIVNTRRAILIGSFIPFIAYVIWEWLILGIVPTYGPGGLAEALKNGDNAVYPLRNFIQNPSVYYLGQSFAFFALITSFLGVSLGLRDFLSDGLHIKKDMRGKLILAALILIFPSIIAILYPHIFLIALDYAGGFGCALLLGLLPIIMVWRGRYQMGLTGKEQLPGGRILLSLLAFFVIFEVLNELKHVFEKF